MEVSVKIQNPFTDLSDKCERLGYVRFEKRLASILSAGLQLRVARDELHDSFSDDDLPTPPPLPRHLEADLAEVSEAARFYQARRVEIQEREVERARVAREAKDKTPPEVNPDGVRTEPAKKPADSSSGKAG